MLSNIRGRALAGASSLTRLQRTPVASISVSVHDSGAPRSTINNGNTSVGMNSSSQANHRRVYSSIPPGLQLPRREPLVKKTSLPIQNSIRTNFSYAGPRKLSDIIKTDLLDEKSPSEISDLWMTYHEGKENVHGLTLDEAKGKSVLSRAAQCPFFIHPVFREEGHFMIVSQFQTPNHFLLAFLEDYQMDPARAQPLLTVSLFDDMAKGKDLTLVRCDIINRGIHEDEGYKICQNLLDGYANEEDFRNVHMFNKKPEAFDLDEFVKEKEQQWKDNSSGGDKTGDGMIEAASESK